MPNVEDAVPEVIDFLDTETVKKAIGSLTAQKGHWKDKAVDPTSGKTYKELFEAASKPKEPQNLPTEPKIETPKPGLDTDSLLDNLEVFKDLKSDELAELRSEARNLKIDPVIYAKSKGGQALLKEFRSTKKTLETTPSPSSRIPVFNGKPVSQTLTDEKASPADKQKAFETLVKGRRNGSE